jgi:hypothetical protein
MAADPAKGRWTNQQCPIYAARTARQASPAGQAGESSNAVRALPRLASSCIEWASDAPQSADSAKKKTDSAHHTLNGCQCMMGIYRPWHNKLCGAGYKSIYRQRQAWCSCCLSGHRQAQRCRYSVLMSRHRLAHESAVEYGHRASSPSERERLDRFRPDIFIQHDMINFHIVESKCCKDTAPDQQRQNAMDQHQELASGRITQPVRGSAHHGPDTAYYDWGDGHNLQEFMTPWTCWVWAMRKRSVVQP